MVRFFRYKRNSRYYKLMAPAACKIAVFCGNHYLIDMISEVTMWRVSMRTSHDNQARRDYALAVE
jgi:hypothetical protein